MYIYVLLDLQSCLLLVPGVLSSAAKSMLKPLQVWVLQPVKHKQPDREQQAPHGPMCVMLIMSQRRYAPCSIMSQKGSGCNPKPNPVHKELKSCLLWSHCNPKPNQGHKELFIVISL